MTAKTKTQSTLSQLKSAATSNRNNLYHRLTCNLCGSAVLVFWKPSFTLRCNLMQQRCNSPYRMQIFCTRPSQCFDLPGERETSAIFSFRNEPLGGAGDRPFVHLKINDVRSREENPYYGCHLLEVCHFVQDNIQAWLISPKTSGRTVRAWLV